MYCSSLAQNFARFSQHACAVKSWFVTPSAAILWLRTHITYKGQWEPNTHDELVAETLELLQSVRHCVASAE